MIIKTIKRMIAGFIFGMAVGNLITIAFSYYYSPESVLIFSESLIMKTGSQAGALALQTIMTGIYGAICFGGMSLYELESWPLMAATFTHYAMILVSFVVIGHYLGWISLTVSDVGIMFILLTIGFFIIWLIMYLKYQSEVRELNKLLLTPENRS